MVNVLFQLCILMVMVTCVSAQVTSFEISSNISTIAGTGDGGYNGDGILATSARIYNPRGVAVNTMGEVIIADMYNRRIRKILLNGTITTIAGTGTTGYNGDGILATSATLSYPTSVAVNSLGEIIIADLSNSRIRKVLLNGTIITIAGTGVVGYNGDSIPATKAHLNNPIGVAVNSLGEIIIADMYSQRIRKVLLDGTITTIAGNGTFGYNGDGILATAAQIHHPMGVAANSLGEVLIADTFSNRIRKILLNGTITTIAGTGTFGYNGDGILATSATLMYPLGVAVNSLGEVFITDQNSNRIRKVLWNGMITTIAGTGTGGYNGDGILATSATLNTPNSVAVNSLGEVLIADTYNNRIRKIINCPANSIKNGTQCQCLDGYYGYGQYCDKFNCSNIVNDRSDVCSSNGQCVSPNNCKCKTGYYGTGCELFDCFGTPKTNASVCSRYGQCIAPNSCTCKPGYSGTNCEQYSCNNILFNATTVCSDSGQCTAPNTCLCKSGYLGQNCETYTCFGISNNSRLACSGVGSCKGLDLCECPTTSSPSSFTYNLDCSQTTNNGTNRVESPTEYALVIAAVVPSVFVFIIILVDLLIIIILIVTCCKRRKRSDSQLVNQNNSSYEMNSI